METPSAWTTVAAAAMSARYVSGRQLPDKAVDTLDTACSRVNISLSSKPPGVEDLERTIQIKTREKNALQRDIDTGRSHDNERLDELKKFIDETEAELGCSTSGTRSNIRLVHGNPCGGVRLRVRPPGYGQFLCLDTELGDALLKKAL